jgi:hypothetical protein
MSRNQNERPWWDGREVVRRPDVPTGLDPDALCLYRTDEERRLGHAAVRRFAEGIAQQARTASVEELAGWLLVTADSQSALPSVESHPE